MRSERGMPNAEPRHSGGSRNQEGKREITSPSERGNIRGCPAKRDAGEGSYTYSSIPSPSMREG